jgi:hypothetical protein
MQLWKWFLSIENYFQELVFLIFIIDVVQDRCLEWFPRLRAISLAVEDVDGEQNEWKTLQGQLDQTQKLVMALSSQLADLRDQMTEQRKHKQRMGRNYLLNKQISNLDKISGLLNSAPSLVNLGERHWGEVIELIFQWLWWWIAKFVCQVLWHGPT